MQTKVKQTILAGLGLAVVAAVPTALVVSCGESASATGALPEGAFPVGGATDMGERNDKSFNNQAFDVVTAFAKDENRFISSGKGGDSTSIASAYRTLAQAGVKTIVAAGYAHKEPIEAVLADASFPKDINFILIDETIASPRVLNINFKSEQIGFLAGFTAAAKAALVDAAEPEVLVYGGFDSAPVYTFMAGFQQGVKYYNDELKPTTKVAITKLGTAREDYFVNSFNANPNAIKEKIMPAIDAGADVVFPVAGPQAGTIIDLLAANRTKYANKFVIGVDADIAAQQTGTDAATKKSIILTSALKNIATTTAAALNLIYKSSIAIPTIYPAATDATTKVFKDLIKNDDPATLWGTSAAGGIGELFVSLPNEKDLPTLIGKAASDKFAAAKTAAITASPTFVYDFAV